MCVFFFAGALAERALCEEPTWKKPMGRPEENFCLKLKSGDAVLLHSGFIIPPRLFVRSGDAQELESGPGAAPPRRGGRIPGARLHLVMDAGMAGRGSSRGHPHRRYLAGPGSAGPDGLYRRPVPPVPRRLPGTGSGRPAAPASAPAAGEASAGLGSSSLLSEKGTEVQDGQRRRKAGAEARRGAEQPPAPGWAGYTHAHPGPGPAPRRGCGTGSERGRQ